MIHEIEHIYPMNTIPEAKVVIGSEVGDPDELPLKEVYIKGFKIGIYPVTQELFQIINKENPSFHKGDKFPVECVSWYDAVEFANQLSIYCKLRPYYNIKKNIQDKKNANPQDKMKWEIIELETNGFRLLSEYEWEYAAADTSLNEAWSELNSNGQTHNVGLKRSNSFGLYDMLGNVSEWCFNWYTDAIEPDGYYKVHKGGSWYDDPFPLRKSYRGAYNPYWKNHTIGFRLAQSL